MDRIVVVFFSLHDRCLILAVCHMYENDNFFICFTAINRGKTEDRPNRTGG